MQVKIGDKIYDAEEIPIMVIFSASDKKNISNMSDEMMKYCAFPDSCDEQEIRKFMKTNKQT